MSFESYEFDEKWFPDNFENNVRAEIRFCLAFYMREKYIVDDNTWLFDDNKDSNNVVVYCPTLNDVFNIDPKIVEHNGCECSHGAWSYRDPVCPHEGSCAMTCYLKNAVYKHSGLARKSNFGFLQRTNRGVVFRIFSCEVNFSGDSYELIREGEFIPREAVRVFFNTDRSTEIYSRLLKGYQQYRGNFSFVGSNWVKKKKYQEYADFVFLGDTQGTLLQFTNENFIMCTSSNFENLVKHVGEARVKEVLKYLRAQTGIQVKNKLGDYYQRMTF